MHCARLGFQCRELLTTGHLNLPIRGEPADWLRAVRHGEVTFEAWWSTVLRLDKELEALEHDERYPAGPDRDRIDRWSIDTHRAIWERLDDSEASAP
jgi:hypothetical protein